MLLALFKITSCDAFLKLNASSTLYKWVSRERQLWQSWVEVGTLFWGLFWMHYRVVSAVVQNFFLLRARLIHSVDSWTPDKFTKCRRVTPITEVPSFLPSSLPSSLTLLYHSSTWLYFILLWLYFNSLPHTFSPVLLLMVLPWRSKPISTSPTSSTFTRLCVVCVVCGVCTCGVCGVCGVWCVWCVVCVVYVCNREKHSHYTCKWTDRQP